MAEAIVRSPLALEVVRSGSDAIVRCRGKLVAGVTDDLYNAVRPLIPEAKRIVLDFTELTHVDSMGLGTLVRLYVSSTSAGCDLQLVNLGKRIRELLGLTNLLSVFALVGDVRLP